MMSGKSVIITGSGRGLGRAYAKAVAEHGGEVVVNDIDFECAVAVRDEIVAAGGKAVASGASVQTPDQAQSLIDCCIENFGKVDCLVNNAAIMTISAPDEESLESIRTTIEVNLLGTVFCGLAAMRQMRRQQAGVIVNVISGAALGLPNMGAYGASKGGVCSLVYNWSLDLAGSPIRVSGLSPVADTRLADSADGYGRTVRPNLAAPEDIAPVLVYLLSDKASHLHGAIVRLADGQLSMIAPPVAGPVLGNNKHWSQEQLHEALGRTTFTTADFR